MNKNLLRQSFRVIVLLLLTGLCGQHLRADVHIIPGKKFANNIAMSVLNKTASGSNGNVGKKKYTPDLEHIKISADDKETYSSNAKLSGLTINGGTLSPSFTQTTFNYTTSVSNAVSAVRVTPTVAEADATVRVNGVLMSSGDQSPDIPLNLGNNIISIMVTAGDGTTICTYSISVFAATGPLPSISYNTPNTFNTDHIITPVVPSGSGVANLIYSAPASYGTGFAYPTGVAVDVAGNVYVADYYNNAVKKIPAGGGSPVMIGSGFSTPVAVAVDAAGNVYVSDNGNYAVKKIPVGGGPPITIGSGYNTPFGIAVDAVGNVYVADKYNNAIKKIPFDGSPTVTVGPSFVNPNGVAIDAAGNIYVAEQGINLLKKIPAGTNSAVTILSGFSLIAGVGVDASGNIYTADWSYGKVMKIPASGGSPIVVASGLDHPYGVAIDPSGKVYIAAQGNSDMKVTYLLGGYSLSAALPPGLTFDEATGTISGQPTIASPAINYTVTAYNLSGSSSAIVNIKVLYVGLGNLLLSSGTISPGFSKDIASYTAGVTNATTSITITPVTTDATSTIKINGAIVAAGQPSASIPLATGPNTITVAIIGQNNSFTSNYTVIVNRLPPPPPLTYNSPNVYTARKAITPLAPTGAGYIGVPKTIAQGFNKPTGVAVDASGNIYVADYQNSAIKKIPAGGGVPITIGSGFDHPICVAVDGAGNVYVGDNGNSAVKKIPAGSNTPVTLGSGFNGTFGVAVDGAGNVYVAEKYNNAIKMIPAVGGATVSIGSGFSNPNGVAVDATGNVYVADQGNHQVKKILAGGNITVAVGSNYGNPAGIAVDVAGDIYVSSFADATVTMIPVNGGNDVVEYYFDGPYGVAVDKDGDIFVADEVGNLIKEYNVWHYSVSPALPPGLSLNPKTGIISGTPTNAYGIADYTVTASNSLAVSSATINIGVFDYALVKLTPSEGAFSPVFAKEVNNYTLTVPNATSGITLKPLATYANAVVKVNGALVNEGETSANLPLAVGVNFITITVSNPDATIINPYIVTVTRLIAPPVVSYTGPNVYTTGVTITPLTPTSSGVAPSGYSTPVSIGSGFKDPTGVAIDAAGNIYVADHQNNAIKKIPAGGGAPVSLGSGFLSPVSIALDAAGNLYIGDDGNHAVKKILAGSNTVVTIASGLNSTYGLAVDAVGNVYVAEKYNSAVKKIPAGGGAIQTLDTHSGNPNGVALDAAGNLYVTDQFDNTLKKFPVGGGSPVNINIGYIISLGGVALDANGNIYVSDIAGKTIEKLSPNGAILAPVGGPFDGPFGMAIDANGSVYVADQLGNAIKKVSPRAYATNPALPAGLVINGSTGTISGTPTAPSPATNYTVSAGNAGGSTFATVNIKVVSDKANLTALNLSSGALSPAFAPETTGYTSGTSVASIMVTPTAKDSGATIKVNGVTVPSGSASASIPLSLGVNIINTVVTSQDGTTTKTYKLTVNRLSTNALLTGLTINTGTLSPAFDGHTISYTATVSTPTITVKPVISNANATIKVLGVTVTSGQASFPIPLNVGSNTITTVITAEDGSTTKIYTLNITRLPVSPSASTTPASAVAVVSATLNGLVNNNGSNTAVSFTYGTSPTLAGGTTVAATTGGNINAGAGETQVSVNLTGLASQVKYYYKVSATNAAGTTTGSTASFTTLPSSNAILSGLSVNTGTLSPAFAQQTTAYTVSVPNTTASITVKPVTANAYSTVKVNGTAVTSGQSSAGVPLPAGTTTAISVIVTAQDGVTVKTYKIAVTRAAGNPIVSTLAPSSVAVATATLNGQADDNGSNTTVSFTYGTSPTLAGSKTAPATTGSSINAGTGNTPANVNISGLNSKTLYYYRISATNSVGTTDGNILSFTTLPSSNAILSGLSTNTGTLSPAFAQQTIAYTISVPNTTSTITVKPVTANAYSTVKINGTAVASGQFSAAIPLNVGTNLITTVVTAQDGSTTKTYKITVTRAVGGLNAAFYSVTKPVENVLTVPEDGVSVHQAVSPNGDGINDILTIDGIATHPENTITIINRNGSVVYEAKGYGNGSKVFDGHSNKTGALQQAGTYFYTLDYKAGDEMRHKAGYLILKY